MIHCCKTVFIPCDGLVGASFYTSAAAFTVSCIDADLFAADVLSLIHILRMILMNTIPVAFISLVIIIGMWRSEYIMTAVFVWFGRAVVAVSIFGLLTGMLDYMLDVKLIHDTPVSYTHLNNKCHYITIK